MQAGRNVIRAAPSATRADSKIGFLRFYRLGGGCTEYRALFSIAWWGVLGGSLSSLPPSYHFPRIYRHYTPLLDVELEFLTAIAIDLLKLKALLASRSPRRPPSSFTKDLLRRRFFHRIGFRLRLFVFEGVVRAPMRVQPLDEISFASACR